MGAETQKTFIEIYNQNVIEPAWAVAKTKTVEGVERLTATGAYKDTEAQMKLVSVSDSDVQLSKKLLQDYVLPKYATQVGPDATKRWNDTIGKVVGLKAVPQ